MGSGRDMRAQRANSLEVTSQVWGARGAGGGPVGGSGRGGGRGGVGGPEQARKRSPYFSESRAMSALSRVSFPGPDFASPAGPAGSKLSGAWAAALCGLSSSESGGPAALQGGGACERQSCGEPRKPPSMRRPMKTDFVSWAPKHAALVKARPSPGAGLSVKSWRQDTPWHLVPCPHLLLCTSSGLSLRAHCPTFRLCGSARRSLSSWILLQGHGSLFLILPSYLILSGTPCLSAGFFNPQPRICFH